MTLTTTAFLLFLFLRPTEWSAGLLILPSSILPTFMKKAVIPPFLLLHPFFTISIFFWQLLTWTHQIGAFSPKITKFHQKLPNWQFFAKNRQIGTFSTKIATFHRKSLNWCVFAKNSQISLDIIKNLVLPLLTILFN